MGNFNFSTPIKIRFDDTDMLGHVNFANYFSYFDVGLTEYMHAIGYDYRQMQAEGTEMVYAEAHCDYKSEARWPELLHIGVRVSHLSRRSLRFEFEIRADADERLVATGHIVSVTMKGDLSESAPAPEALRAAIMAYEGDDFAVQGR